MDVPSMGEMSRVWQSTDWLPALTALALMALLLVGLSQVFPRQAARLADHAVNGLMSVVALVVLALGTVWVVLTSRLGVRVLLVGVATLATISTVLAGDLYLHQRYAESGGLNAWGYRGPTVGAKRPGEWRVAVLGGSTAFGYGVRWDQAFPAQLERMLRVDRDARVLNLGYNAEGAYSFRFTLQDFAFLDYDAVLLYTGYNDLGGANTFNTRHDSAVFRWTGYWPIFPLVFREKAMALRYDGRLDDAYRGVKTVFRPSLPARATAGVLEATASIATSLDAQRLVLQAAVSADPSCAGEWAFYCGQIYLALDAVPPGVKVYVVSQPRISESHDRQQDALRAHLRTRWPHVRTVDLRDAVDLRDPALCSDGMHLTAEGNRRIASALLSFVRGG